MDGYCECGCGQKTKIAPQSSKRLGWIKGRPVRFVVGHSGGTRGKTLGHRFWEKVRKSPACWEWMGSRNNRGYGQIRIDRKCVLAHRSSWEMTFGPIPDGICVLHKCDNPACVRPDHLFLGTLSDNTQDMIKKGRRVFASGEKCATAKLTNEQTQEMRRLYGTGQHSTYKLGKQFGVSHFAAWEIVTGRRYPAQKCEGNNHE